MNTALTITCSCALLILSGCANQTPPASAPEAETPSIPPADSSSPPDLAMGELDDPLKGRQVLPSLPAEFYGKWRLTASGGGFDGHQDPPPRDGEMIVITKANEIVTYKGGNVVSTVPFRITRGPSIFGNDNWMIQRGGMDLDVVRLRGTDELHISENHVECQSWSYARIP